MSIFKDSILYLFAEFLAKITPFLITPYLARVMGASGYGLVSYYQTIILLILIFIGMSQEGAITRYYYKYGKNSLGIVVQTCYLYNVIVSLILMIIFFLLNKNEYILLTLVASLQSIFSVQLALRQCQKKAKEYLFLQFYNAIFLVLILLYFFKVLNFLDVKGWLYSLGGAYVLSCIMSFRNYPEIFLNKLNYRRFKIIIIYFLSFGVPLLLHQFSMFAKGHFDKIFIYSNFSLGELGVYSGGVQIASIVSVGILALNKALLPYYFELLKKGVINSDNVKTIFWYSFLIIPIPFLLFVSVKEMYYLMFLGEDFKGVKKIVDTFVLGFTLIVPYLILVNYFFYKGSTKLIAVISLISSLFYIFFVFLFSELNIYLIPIAMIISNTSQILLLYFFIRQEGRI